MKSDEFLVLLRIQRYAQETERYFTNEVAAAVRDEEEMAKFATSNSHNSPARYNKLGRRAAAAAVKVLHKKFEKRSEEFLEPIRRALANKLAACSDNQQKIAA